MNWKYKIIPDKIKNLSKDKITNEMIAETCKSLLSQLEIVKVQIDKTDGFKNQNQKQMLINGIDMHHQAFDTILKASALNEDEQFEQYDIEDIVDSFNEALNELYDFADMHIMIGDTEYKFIWIEPFIV